MQQPLSGGRHPSGGGPFGQNGNQIMTNKAKVIFRMNAQSCLNNFFNIFTIYNCKNCLNLFLNLEL